MDKLIVAGDVHKSVQALKRARRAFLQIVGDAPIVQGSSRANLQNINEQLFDLIVAIEADKKFRKNMEKVFGHEKVTNNES